jgi:hypothetical protein
MNFPNSPVDGQSYTSPDGAAYIYSGGVWVMVASGTGGGDPHSGAQWEIRLNPVTIASSISVPTGMNGSTAGPVTVNAGVTVDVASGSTWTVI